MAVTFTSVKCPECGADLPIEEGRSSVFCSYCGARVLVTNENEFTYNYNYRHIDEAGIKKAETDRMVRLRELDLTEKTDSNRKLLTNIWLVVSLILIVIAVILMLSKGNDSMPGWAGGFLFLCYACFPIIGGGAFLVFKVIPEKENEKAVIRAGGVRFPRGLEPFDGKNYEVVLKSLESAGFNNITCINMHDLTLGIFQKPGKIERITIDGKVIPSGGKFYMPDVPITITYHGK